MDLCVMPRLMNRVMYDAMRDFDRLERSIFPYWREADHSVLHVANETQQIVDDDKKFAVSLDVSQFRPEELNVPFGRASFTRKWLLPENVDLEAVRTQLNDKGHLSVEAPKKAEGHENKRTIPIMAAPPKN
ncbi:Hsp20/alpha crystallin family protein [Ostertagia ostertagi]